MRDLSYLKSIQGVSLIETLLACAILAVTLTGVILFLSPTANLQKDVDLLCWNFQTMHSAMNNYIGKMGEGFKLKEGDLNT